MTPHLNPLFAAGADPELRFMSAAERIDRLVLAEPALAPVLDPATAQAPLICMIFPVKEDQPAEQPAREDDPPTEPTPQDPPTDTRH